MCQNFVYLHGNFNKKDMGTIITNFQLILLALSVAGVVIAILSIVPDAKKGKKESTTDLLRNKKERTRKEITVFSILYMYVFCFFTSENKILPSFVISRHTIKQRKTGKTFNYDNYEKNDF